MSRRTPYTEAGIRRLRCYRCRKRRASQQWQICADRNVYRAVCTECDIELNELVLRWVGDPNADAKLARYRERMARAGA